MTVLLYGLSGEFIAPGTLEPVKGLPTLVKVPELDNRTFMRHDPAWQGESGRYDEVRPVDVELLKGQ